MPDRDLSRRIPFGIDENALHLLDRILSRAAEGFANEIRRSYSEKGELSEYDQRQLERDLERHTKMEYVISCSDKTSNHKLDLNGLISFPNYDHARIETMAISVGHYDGPNVTFDLRDDPTLFTNIRGQIRGDYTFINDYGTQIEDWFKSIRKSYWWAYRASIPIAFLMSLVFVVLPMVYFSLPHVTVETDDSRIKAFVGVTFIAVVVGFVVTPIWIWLGRRFFPIGEFAIGRGASRQRRREYVIYSLIGVSVLLSLAVRMLGGLLIH